jgi:N6-adenosine-specific RNA methylase IME4
MESRAMKYGAILADPPWKFNVYSSLGLGRSAEAWYDVMNIHDIMALQVENMAAENCVLFLWTTDPFLRQAFDVIDAWGFTYKTVGFYWIKTPSTWFGTGYWTRANPEQCLLATRGHPHRINADVPKLIEAPRREHSRKPDETRERIQRLCGGPYLELFARERTGGWDSIGNEVDLGPRSERKWNSKRGPKTYNADLMEL